MGENEFGYAIWNDAWVVFPQSARKENGCIEWKDVISSHGTREEAEKAVMEARHNGEGDGPGNVP